MASMADSSRARPEEGQAPATGSSAPSEPSEPAAGAAAPAEAAVEGSRPAPATEVCGQAGRPKTGAQRTRSGSRGKKRRKRSPVKDKPGRRRREREREREQRKGRVLGSEGPARAADQILVTAPICRESRARYMFGNYDQYYKQRFDRYATVDPRVQGVLLKAGNIFADKVVLDIGCNTGFITFLVAAMGARQVEGVDIDVTCISRALRYLRWLKQKGYKTLPEEEQPEANEGSRKAEVAEAAAKEAPTADEAAEATAAEAEAPWYTKQYPVSYVQSRGHIPYHAKPLEAGALQKALASAKVLEKAVPVKNSSAAPRPGFPYNIEFRSENVLYTQVEGNRNVQYDVVLLFRLTKWIHINWGDLGIKRLFTRCNEWLRLGGLLVLEVKDLAGQPYAKENCDRLSELRSLWMTSWDRIRSSALC
ncbi:Mepce [Symbiodinium sp. CCMP2456]|nr:Mepce [Symbiodinium sp. CCMP2456]